MKLYIVYSRSMEDSPEVTIECATANEDLAKAKFAETKALADKFTKEHENESCDEEPYYWYEARMESFDITEDRKPGDIVYVLTETIWHECVETTVMPYLNRVNADYMVTFSKDQIKLDYPEIYPFDEDESFEESFHLTDESVMVDVYYSVEPITIQ